MNTPHHFVLALRLFCSMPARAHRQQISGKLLGKLVYSVYSNEHHTLEVQWL